MEGSFVTGTRHIASCTERTCAYVGLDVVIGIVGKEGLQASLAADYSILEFQYLNTLLLSPGNSTLVEEVNDINERLKWQELEEE